MTNRQANVVSGLQLWQWRIKANQAAIAHNIPIAEVDWLLQEIADLDRLALRLESFKDWSEVPMGLSLDKLDQLWQRRLGDRLPVQYIAGVTPWRKFKLTVSSAVLIPRPETECLIDLAVAAVANSESAMHLQQGHWVDLGTGSGAIALGLADAFPEATIHAVDCSVEALAIAQQNAWNAGLFDRMRFYQGRWWEPLSLLKGQFNGMVSNPPYIPSDIVPTLQPEVVNHEPHLALDGGADGLDAIRHLIEVAPSYLRPGGIWLIEMMAGQADAVQALLLQQGSYSNIQIHSDLAGIERFALAQIQ
ncbi:peptide chain release factor N(5)-glutamine methyltransferase [Anabaena sp. FACHB-709]|uniref:Release factor glutamine methyltransferase n=2 Tax=Nostocaceae TaxID=1162 RepID=A0A1Z4KQD1_ANAVA|nr:MULTISPECIES: peptide chain release factor N(5)-glutamine methyltransferase [Nostocaceae]BAY71083.1 protoporphyrinogen oxidase [Trichormus variabilis NIES-23]HBW29297.1 peptide chain release factor N(5)-glutamine methyltransferase [Nostoc sp. UBA8866]MBD2171881.1 peptide chain release factor N(5)-glutamine methyltransferase [Anabaena cylindrica FACHB-318]MBD2263459.1 peptide chain release factor N(5)-glutamine methyltransferase [Anabaena sp. FACHB-709]MBD2273003.1 peptide chain release fact